MKKESNKMMTTEQALQDGYIHYIYDEGEFSRLKSIEVDAIDFDRNPILVEKEGYHHTAPNSKNLAELIAEHVYCDIGSETGDDDIKDVYDAIEKIDFTYISQQIQEILNKKTYYRSANISLIK